MSDDSHLRSAADKAKRSTDPFRQVVGEWLESAADHAESEYQCCDYGARQCWEMCGPAMKVADLIHEGI